MNRLQERYTNEITKNLMKKFGYKSTMQIPKMEKIVINIGEIRRKQKEEKKTRAKGKSKLAWASGGALTSTKQLRRYLRNLDTEIDVRTAREKAADKAALRFCMTL